MRERGSGRRAVFPWRDAHGTLGTTHRWGVGSAIYSGSSRGTVISVDAKNGVMAIQWDDGSYGPITYPLEADYLRGPLPWET